MPKILRANSAPGNDPRRVFRIQFKREFLIRLLQKRRLRSDDIRRVCPVPDDVPPTCIGPIVASLSRAGVIRRGEFRSSTRSAAHARPLPEWHLSNRRKAAAMLAALPDAGQEG